MAYLKKRSGKRLLLFCFLLCSLNGFGQNADINLLKSINLNRPVALDPFFRTLTNTTYPISIAIPVVMFSAGCIKRDSSLKMQSIQITAALFAAAVATEALKVSVQRPRPFTANPLIQKAGEGDGASFPSGHVSIAFATATSLSLINHHWYVVVPSYLWASAIAYSRMDLGVHYPSDVLAGALIGSAAAVLSYKLNHWLHKKCRLLM